LKLFPEAEGEELPDDDDTELPERVDEDLPALDTAEPETEPDEDGVDDVEDPELVEVTVAPMLNGALVTSTELTSLIWTAWSV